MIYIIPTDTCFGLACSIDDKISYDKIYKIKGRPKNKPFAIMIDEIYHLSSLLNEKQIEFLKNYSRPWTILIDKQKFNLINWELQKEQNHYKIEKKQQNSPFEKGLRRILKNNNSSDFLANIINNKILNSKTYDKISFRVSNNDIQKKLISEIWPIFLTSANISWENEIYTIKELETIFWKDNDIKILAKKDLQKVSPSDVFEFIWETTKLKYLRKN